MDIFQHRASLFCLCLVLLTACQVPGYYQQEEVVEDVQPSPTEVIYRQLRSDKPENRVQALQSLTKRPELMRKSISLILTLLADDRQVDISKYVGSGFYSGTVSSPAAMAAELLSKLSHWAVLPLRLRLHDSNPVVRQYATRALGLMAEPEYAEWLLAALQDTSAAVSKEAYTGLLKQDAQVYVTLIDKLDVSRLTLRQELLLIQLLGNSRSSDALPTLFRFSRDSNPTVRNATFVALAKFPDADLKEIVLQGLRDDDMQVRENALLLAPLHNSEQVLSAVIEQLSVGNETLRQTAIRVLPVMTGEQQHTAVGWQQWWLSNNRAQ